MHDLLIDGSHGEGGGQVLRTSLALSAITGRPFRMVNVRANRKPPGLKPQHLMAVRAAAQICAAGLEGDEVGSETLRFAPEAVRPGEYRFDIGTAGSTMLVLQTVLMPLLLADGDSSLTITGGTYNTHAPPFDFVRDTFLPVLRTMGAAVQIEQIRPGFYPRGGGEVRCEIAGRAKLQPLSLMQRGKIQSIDARAIVAGLDPQIGRREINSIRAAIRHPISSETVEESPRPSGPGNAVLLTIRTEGLTETFSAIGERGRRAEDVATQAAAEANEYLDADVPVGPHLADQLLLPMAVGAGGEFVTTEPTLHTTTNIAVIGQWLGRRFEIERDRLRVNVRAVHQA
jgi:RNA 3'-terminal phosphate cyclase (ATP)